MKPPGDGHVQQSSMARSISKESIDNLKRKVSKNRTRSKEKMVKVVMIPQSVMLGFNPRSFWPWGFDGCGDGNAKFLVPNGFEYDQKLEELVDDLNGVSKVGMAPANIISILGLGVLVGLCVVVSGMLADSPPLMVIAIVGVIFFVVPVVMTGRFYLKDAAVQSYISRLEEKLPSEKGIVHWERLEYGRLSVWNAPFVGHRTGLTQRTAIAVELFLANDSLKSLDAEMSIQSGNVKAGKIYNMNDTSNQSSALEEDVVKVQRVTNFLWNIGLGRLSAAIRRNRLTFEKISKTTDSEWRDMGIDRTEVKLIKTNVKKYLEAERQAIEQEERDLQRLKDKAINRIRGGMGGGGGGYGGGSGSGLNDNDNTMNSSSHKDNRYGGKNQPMMLPQGARDFGMAKMPSDPTGRGSIYCYTVAPEK